MDLCKVIVILLNMFTLQTKEERPREIILCREFAIAVAHLNHSLPQSDRIRFIQCDMHMFLKRLVSPDDVSSTYFHVMLGD